ncbi:hypothetical protein Salat_1228300 [Sesamum alatum]|uniref:Uncharacterized protein n=1 Tax=Sesamum alatum TaxID=300844 RepID=A0AAE1YFE4_9LAMI|nr:hypothetical protein Salat_1228300 [Sesamum alatum]
MFIYVEVEGDEGLVRNEVDGVGEGEVFTFLGPEVFEGGGEGLKSGEGGEGGECVAGGESLQGGEGEDFHDSDFEGEELHEGREGDEEGEGVEEIEEEQEYETEALEQAASIETQQPNILPPLQVDIEEEKPEACLTQDQLQPQAAPPPPVYMPGPSMFHQLQMTHPQSSLQPRITIRAPPPFRGRQILPSFSTKPRNATSHPILKERGHKFLDLNQMKSPES